MNVLHLPYGAAMIDICSALSQKGIQATSCHLYSNRYNFKPDICMNLQNVQKGKRENKIHEIIKDAIKDYDVFHFHFGETFLPDKSDLEILKKANKKLVVHHHGSEVRTLTMARNFNNPYVLVKPQWTEDLIHKNLTLLSNYIDHAIVQDHELEPYIRNYYKNIHVIPNAVNLDDFSPKYPKNPNSVPLVVHAPTSRDLKGTEFVLNAVEQLKNSGLRFNFKLIEQMTFQEAKNLMEKADIVIDQLRIGAYGFVSTEAMAYGKAVICYIRDDLIKKYPEGLPIANATPKTIRGVLENLISDPQKCRELGMNSRKYVEKNHNIQKSVEKYINIYNQL